MTELEFEPFLADPQRVSAHAAAHLVAARPSLQPDASQAPATTLARPCCT